MIKMRNKLQPYKEEKRDTSYIKSGANIRSSQPTPSQIQPIEEKFFTDEDYVEDGSIPELDVPSLIITSPNILHKLASALPIRYRTANWTLLYSTDRHGISLATLYKKVKGRGACLVIVEDQDGFFFGGFLPDALEPKKNYYGTGEAFLFSAYPSFNLYPWSGLNEYFMLCKEDWFAIGGGG